jgi:hypothetical protein
VNGRSKISTYITTTFRIRFADARDRGGAKGVESVVWRHDDGV